MWQDGGCENDIYCKRDSIATVAGKYYGGHSPCKSGNNYQECGVWVKIHPSGRKNFMIFIAKISLYLIHTTIYLIP